MPLTLPLRGGTVQSKRLLLRRRGVGMTDKAQKLATDEGFRRILVVQHVPYEPLGTLDALLRARKIRIRYVNFARNPEARPDLDGYDALIVLGGPMNLDQQERHPHLKTELELLAAALARGTPVLGICLGAQLLAHALGAAVGRNSAKELGWHEVRLTPAGQGDGALQQLGPRAPAFHWHGDTFALPSGAEHLAESDLCPNQAFRYGKQTYGLQFHLEVDAHLIDRWLRLHARELAATRGAEAAQLIYRETEAWIAASQQRSEQVFGQLLHAFGWRHREAPLHMGHGDGP